MTNSTDLSARYGNTRPRDSVLAWIVGSVAVVGFIAWALWVNVTDRSAGIDWVAFESTTGGQSASVTWHLTAPELTAVTCALRTVGPDMATNGWRVVQIAPTAELTATYTESIRAVGTATGVDVYACWRTNP